MDTQSARHIELFVQNEICTFVYTPFLKRIKIIFLYFLIHNNSINIGFEERVTAQR